MARSLLIRGMLAGLAAGVVAFVVASLFGEGAIAHAIAYEGSHSPAHGGGDDPELVSRGVQSTIGLLTATLLYGVGIGGVFALVFAALSGRIGNFGARTLAGLLALAGFVVIGVVPFLKYPPNPPGVDGADSIGRRTALYLALVAISVLVAVLAVIAGRRLGPALGAWDATIVAALGFVVVMGLVQWTLPDLDAVVGQFPAATLYEFRIASLALQASVWASLGLVFGALAQRALEPPAAAASGVPAHSAG
jgi:predicted cobalt transporter CbtA